MIHIALNDDNAQICTIFNLYVHRGIPRRLPQYPIFHSVVLLGDAGVGKTCMIQNFVKGSNTIQTFKPTLGIEYSSKNIELTNNHIVKAQIWDTAGQENYRSVTVE
jgi:hypothetical protein